MILCLFLKYLCFQEARVVFTLRYMLEDNTYHTKSTFLGWMVQLDSWGVGAFVISTKPTPVLRGQLTQGYCYTCLRRRRRRIFSSYLFKASLFVPSDPVSSKELWQSTAKICWTSFSLQSPLSSKRKAEEKQSLVISEWRPFGTVKVLYPTAPIILNKQNLVGLSHKKDFSDFLCAKPSHLN